MGLSLASRFTLRGTVVLMRERARIKQSHSTPIVAGKETGDIKDGLMARPNDKWID
jgi:hypothetical protein